jgi:hypothetical protein
VAVQAGALVTLGHARQAVGRFEGELAKDFHY